MSERFYKISEVAEILSIEQHTLRYLENTLKLKIKRDERGDRLYTESDLETLRLILALKAKGLNTTAIKMALENNEEVTDTEVVPSGGKGLPEARELLDTAKKIAEQNEHLVQQNRNIEERLQRMEEKLNQRDTEREKKVNEFLQLWKNEQGKNKSWLPWLRK
ncbi:MAG: MerR family transcriptional regulator [Syntrophomonadaceae bacterium]|jgi:DNA-binding transcriptional MerR regulator|nr:MerR family transcriptional regulator [Syntrophomonadaceae bacterium]